MESTPNVKDLEYLGELTDGGYVWEKIYYDNTTKQFVKDKFHCGSVDDCADFYDGREVVSEKELIKQARSNVSLLSNMTKYAIAEKESIKNQIDSFKKLDEFEDSALTTFFDVKSLDDLSLYCICVNENGIPLLEDGNIILFYTEKEKAEQTAQNISKNFDENTIQAIKIKDVYTFFANVSALGSRYKFMVDGCGRATKFTELCSQVAGEKIVSKEAISHLQSAMRSERPNRSPQLIAQYKESLKKDAAKQKSKEKYVGIHWKLISLLCPILAICSLLAYESKKALVVMIGLFVAGGLSGHKYLKCKGYQNASLLSIWLYIWIDVIGIVITIMNFFN